MPTTTISAGRLALFLILAVGGCAVDLATKDWIFRTLGMPFQSPPIVLVPGVFSLATSLNEGGLFGVGQGMQLLFAILSLTAGLGILYWVILGGAGRDLWLTIALGCVMAGIFGNLYDRLGLPGLIWQPPDPRAGEPVYAVRDWLHFEIEAIGFDWPVFNLADSLLVFGAAMLFWHAIWRERRRAAAATSSTSAAV